MRRQRKTGKRTIKKIKNKLQKVGVFFAPEKVVAKAPRSPRKPPQKHHNKTGILPKPPAKTHVHHKIKTMKN
jgi:hypothetical protein